jgi:hypothetical protein
MYSSDMSPRVNIDGIPKGAVLAALFNSSPPTGVAGWIDNLRIGDPIGPGRGEALFREHGPRFTCLGGRWLEVDLSESSFDPAKYDEYLGAAGAAEAAIRPLREAGPDAWVVPQSGEEEMAFPFARTEAPGLLANGTAVIKIETDLHDDEHLELTGAEDGDRGVVLGSSRLPWGKNGIPIPFITVYYVEWGHEPNVAFAVLASCIAPLKSERKVTDDRRVLRIASLRSLTAKDKARDNA